LDDVLGRRVDVARLGRVRERAALLLLRAVDEGRVVLDRDGEWAPLRERRRELARRAGGAHAARRQRARTSVRELHDEA
jgi:hypothetical protein